ncbi:MAG: hypothetical protein CBD58_02395 [bacterium TMED198]|nr:MAG: hypothetical protein CBD58_02395 [bacterium TMED198]
MIEISANYLLSRIKSIPKFCVVAGSGLSSIESIIKDKIKINFYDVPGFNSTVIKGHGGYFIFGNLEGCLVLFSIGRYHYYEGYSKEQVSMPIRVFQKIGIKNIILTNSAGCVNRKNSIGQLLIIDKFLDCSYIVNSKSPNKVKVKNQIKVNSQIINSVDIKISYGTYAWVLGPTYETIAETKDLFNLGADSVGMSTFPEYQQANKLNMNILILSYLSNYAGGSELITHQEVLDETSKHVDEINIFIKQIIKQDQKTLK